MCDQPEKLFEAAIPLDEAKLAKNRPLIETIRRVAKQPGPVLNPDEFKAWLARQ